MGYEAITLSGLDRESQCEHTFHTLIQAEYNRLCEERGIDTVDEQMVSTAFNRLMFTPIERMVELEAQLAAEASAVEELKQAYIVARAVQHQSDPYDKGRQSGYVMGLQAALEIVTRQKVAALVQAEVTQPNSTESEVRE